MFSLSLTRFCDNFRGREDRCTDLDLEDAVHLVPYNKIRNEAFRCSKRSSDSNILEFMHFR